MVAETKKQGPTNITQIYNNIINSIKEAEEAAEVAEKAANDAAEVKEPILLSVQIDLNAV